MCNGEGINVVGQFVTTFMTENNNGTISSTSAVRSKRRIALRNLFNVGMFLKKNTKIFF